MLIFGSQNTLDVEKNHCSYICTVQAPKKQPILLKNFPEILAGLIKNFSFPCF